MTENTAQTCGGPDYKAEENRRGWILSYASVIGAVSSVLLIFVGLIGFLFLGRHLQTAQLTKEEAEVRIQAATEPIEIKLNVLEVENLEINVTLARSASDTATSARDRLRAAILHPGTACGNYPKCSGPRGP